MHEGVRSEPGAIHAGPQQKVDSGPNSRSKGCTAGSGSLHRVSNMLHGLWIMRSLGWGVERARPERTGQGLAIFGSGGGGDTRVLEVAKLCAGLGSFGLDAIDNGA
jgi:hypothetical protein